MKKNYFLIKNYKFSQKKKKKYWIALAVGDISYCYWSKEIIVVMQAMSNIDTVITMDNNWRRTESQPDRADNSIDVDTLLCNFIKN